MADYDEFEERLRRYWHEDPAEPLCANILKYMNGHALERLEMLTFRDFLRITGRSEYDEQLIRAVAILVGTLDALDTKYMFIEDDGEDEVEIDDSDIQAARRDGVFYHPHTGRPVENYESKLFPFFTPSRTYLRARGVVDE